MQARGDCQGSRTESLARAARADGSYPELLDRLAKTRLLILDDFGLALLGGRHAPDQVAACLRTGWPEWLE